MLVYKIEDKLTKVENPNGEESIYIMLLSQWEKFPKENLESDKFHGAGNLGGCYAYSHSGYVSGAVRLPKVVGGHNPELKYLISSSKLIFVCSSQKDMEYAQKICLQIVVQNKRPTTFFCQFLQRIVWDDAAVLQAVEEEIQSFEESVEEAGRAGGKEFNLEFSKFSKRLLLLDRYYDSLAGVAQELSQNDAAILDEKEVQRVGSFSSRIAHLQETVHMLREYSMQVREMYQAQIDLNQNEIMKVLTIVTTVVLPLTLIAGWYGMNFAAMPELTWRYGYIAVSVVSVLVVILSIIYFKRKKFF